MTTKLTAAEKQEKRDFKKINDGFTAHFIITAFHKRYPSLNVFNDEFKAKEKDEKYWLEYSRRLRTYAMGFKDALKHVEKQAQMREEANRKAVEKIGLEHDKYGGKRPFNH